MDYKGEEETEPQGKVFDLSVNQSTLTCIQTSIQVKVAEMCFILKGQEKGHHSFVLKRAGWMTSISLNRH